MQKLKEKEQSEEQIPAHVVGTKEIQLLPIQAILLISEDLPIFYSQPSYQETLDKMMLVYDIFHPPQFVWIYWLVFPMILDWDPGIHAHGLYSE